MAKATIVLNDEPEGGYTLTAAFQNDENDPEGNQSISVKTVRSIVELIQAWGNKYETENALSDYLERS